MSKYTTEVRFICENYSGLDESKGYNKVEEIIANSRAKVFDFNYPIYDEEYRSVLETKILKHFYTREIGAETVGLWKLWLNTKMNEIMPYYNQRYKSALIEFNPLLDTDITTDRDTNNNGSSNRNNSGNNESSNNSHSKTDASDSNDSWKYYSDTPQGGVSGIASMTYLTNATHDTANNSGETETRADETATGSYSDITNNTYSNTEDYIEHITGKRSGVSYSKMLEEFRQTFLNIDMEVIHELDDLFMNLW